MENVCRRFRQAALSLPCYVWLSWHIDTPATADSVLRCLRGRVPGDLTLKTHADENACQLGQLAAKVLPTVTRCAWARCIALPLIITWAGMHLTQLCASGPAV